MHYLYDGTFDGFLTCIFEHYAHQKATAIFPQKNYQKALGETSKTIITDYLKAERVHKGIKKKMGFPVLNKIYYVFLTQDDQKDTLLLNYISLGFELGRDIYYSRTHPTTLPIEKRFTLVSREVHRFLGILRFQECEDLLYASFHPDHDIITLLADHFVERMPEENLIIHDKKRDSAIFAHHQQWYFTQLEKELHPIFSQKEKEIQTLWHNYFTHTAIATRYNLKLQNQFIPLRYHKDLIEFKIFSS